MLGRILLFSGSVFAGAILGALCGSSLATNGFILSSANIIFACGWGAAFGVIPALGLAAHVIDQGSSKASLSVLYATLAILALVSGGTIYLLSIQTAAI